MTEQEKAEIIAELRKEMFLEKQNKNCLKPTLDKWCNTPDVYTSKMRTAFDGDGVAEAAVWECIRKITCKIMRTSYVNQIRDVDKANNVADAICAVVYTLAKEVGRKEGENIDET